MTNAAWIKELPIAHRGYHDLNNAIWENTLSAFSRAVEAGFAIECDLHYASDGVPVIFHDEDLERLCNLKGDVRERTSGELGLIAVGGTKDKVPTLKQLLDLVQGKVPLVLELKGRDADDEGFAETVLEVLEGYEGKVALMSFDHWLLKDLKDLNAPYPVGLTANGNTPEEYATHEKAMRLGLDFISYYYGDLPNPFITTQRDCGVPVITWTVRDEEARKRTFDHADQMTFEGFDPRAAV
ncbi:glycerophosphoryl diester phosphodiesterase [Rhizobium sp. BK529]|uniref:glycerophosphodiester phosphodiesterase n=1 Tax=unclassified Rhizobium TaxID=2613769 RepID=UPI001048D378|nr:MULTISPECIES: glycerophosphodiester phosphodiesterase [unclassified Rhizobium]MBB3591373.1 glycerophosphoryl diester phosphodiesterase [Rhizobium sp. BK529]TCS08676.1 glycerophosphoryl diester phosphodiesterase [Rhizobium sp. BK418]